MKQARIPGLQIALIRDGRMVWHHNFGVRNAATSEKVTDETIFEAASLTKPLFAYYVMRLVDQGVISLDKPLLGYLPVDFVEKFLGHPLGGKGFRRDWFEKITVRHILSHSSGMPQGESAIPYPLFFEPGTSWKYSAEGYFFLQKAVEYLKGDKLENLMQREVLDPLGMTRSGLVWKDEFEKTMAHGHGFFAKPEDFRKRMEAHAGASLYTTAEDYAKFVSAVLNGRDLRPESSKEMLTRQIDMGKEKGLGWCLGFGTQNDANGQAIWQWGDFGIFRNYVIAYPGERSGILFLTNSIYGLGICSEIVGRSLGGQVLGGVWLDYRPYDSPLYRFAWEMEAEGPRAVRKLKGLMRKYPKTFDQDVIGFLAESFQDADMFPQALAILRFDLKEHPRSGSSQAVMDWHLEYRRGLEKPKQLEEDYLKKIAGNYGPRRLEFKNGRLYYLRKGGANPAGRPLIAISQDTFILEGLSHFRLKVEFDGQGNPVKLAGVYIDDTPRDESPRDK
ncbi:MAG: serine hydrolase [Acidobacteriota bacterium]|nr:serine hydrolase [Acidobacteriota bacterium]